MESINNRLKAHVMNGEHCLSLSLTTDLTLHHFHLGMVNSQKKINVVPMHCGYVSGIEAIVFNVSGLVPIHQYLSKNVTLEVNDFLAMLGSTILHLMDYHLNPGNLLLGMEFIYWDSQNQNLKLIYLPLENEQETTSNQLETTIIKIIETFQSMKSNVKPKIMSQSELIQLLIDLRTSAMSIRQMALRISALASLEHIDVRNVMLQDHRMQDPIENCKEADGRVETSKLNVKRLESKRRELVPVKMMRLKQKKGVGGRSAILARKWYYVPFAIAIVFTMVCTLWTSFKIDTKVGIGLMSLSLGLYASMKMKGLVESKKNQVRRDAAIKPDSGPVFNHVEVDRVDKVELVETQYARRQSQKINEETVKIDMSCSNLYLMLRTDEDPRFIPIESDLVSIGRNPAICDVLLDEAGIGRLHAELHRSGDQIYLKDMHSVNGTFLNGKRIISNQYCELKKGDQIKIGTKELVLT